MKSRKKVYALIGLVTLGFIACSDFDPDADAPDTDAAPSFTASEDALVNVGPVDNIVAQDEIDRINAIRDFYAATLAGFVGDQFQDSFFQTKDPLYQSGYTDNQDDQVLELNFNDVVVPCSQSGTQTIEYGEFYLVTNINFGQGTLVGSWTTTYENCLDTTVYSVSDGSCAVTPLINGSFVSSLTIDFNYRFLANQDFSETLTETISFTADHPGAVGLTVTVGSNASEQTFSFDDSFTSLAGALRSPSGSAIFESEFVDLTSLRNQLLTTTKAVACPSDTSD